MKRSVNRVLTTHVGSLARPADLVELVQKKSRKEPYDGALHARRVREAVTEAVRRQADLGIDVVNDGEQSKWSFRSYIDERISGFEKQAPGAASQNEYLRSREWQAFPEYYALPRHGNRSPIMTCTAPIRYVGQAELAADIENLRVAVKGIAHEDVFITAVSPAYMAAVCPNEHYRSYEEYEQAWGDAVREEYKAIIAAGFVVQLDDPRWVTYYTLHPELSVAECRKWMEQRVEAINYAIRGLPQEQIRFHTCYSLNIGPRVHELELKDIADLMLKINAGAYSFEGANPRHEHEYHVWESLKLPEGKVLMPGMISHTTNLVEHPDFVAERIERLARIVGRESVIAGADCGFSTVAMASGELEIHPTVVGPKLSALAEGARIASKRLWGPRSA